MDFYLIAATSAKPRNDVTGNTNNLGTNNETLNINEEFSRIGGRMAGICYSEQPYYEIKDSASRIARVKNDRHHSVFDHEYMTIYLENVPKLFAMVLNNEKVFATSEKSARYTKMQGTTDTEVDLYLKWQKIFEQLIFDKYGNEKYFNASRIEKLAQENARYFLSVYTPTSLAYTASFRQFSYLYAWLKQIEKTDSELLSPLTPTANAFCKFLEENHLIDETIASLAPSGGLSLETHENRTEYFGDVFMAGYVGSFAQYAQAQRHRSLDYQLKLLPEFGFYIPPIIKNTPLENEWLGDALRVQSVTPQGQLIQIYERGTPERFIMKLGERLCTAAQFEIANQTQETLKKYIDNCDSESVKRELEKYSHGARCTAGYQCKTPCAFGDGINLTREI